MWTTSEKNKTSDTATRQNNAYEAEKQKEAQYSRQSNMKQTLHPNEQNKKQTKLFV